MAERYDLVVVGSGPAGEKAAAAAAFWGKRVALVERADVPGGAMVAGVVSSKTMREAALYLTGFTRRQTYDIGLELTPDVATERLRRRTDDVVGLMADSVSANLRRHRIDVFSGDARLGPDRSVVVVPTGGGEPRTLMSSVIMLAVGSRPFHPHGVPFDDVDVLDSDEAAHLDRPLRSVVVVGGGAIGCEYASVFAALGAEVTLVQGGARLLSFMDSEIAEALEVTLRERGVRIIDNAGHVTATRTSAGLRVELATGESVIAEKAIFATGRVGNTEGLGLDAAGVKVDERGRVIVDDRYQTTVDGIYAVGDVIGPPALASVSMEQARIAVTGALDLPLKRSADLWPPFGVYSVPEAAMVGITEAAAAERGIDYAVGRARFAGNARAAISGATEGLLKLVFEAQSLQLLGVHILGESATELIHLGQSVMHFNGTIEYFVHSTFNVPTTSEAYKYAAYDGLAAVGK